MPRHSYQFAFPSAIVWLVFLLVVFVCSMPTFGQTEKKQDEIVCALETLMVTVRVELIGKVGSPVADKRMKDFSIFEDGVEQEIDYLRVSKVTDPRGQRAIYFIGYSPIDGTDDLRSRKIEVVLLGVEDKRILGLFSPVSYSLKELKSLPPNPRG